jgi:O-methyltransferase
MRMDSVYRSLQGLARRFGYNFEVNAFSNRGFPSYVEPDFIKLVDKYRNKTMVPWGGLHMAYRAARYVAENNLPGAVVECGVWRGGCALLMADAIAQAGGSYDFYLYDTYAGMSEPGDEDTSVVGHARAFFDKAKRGKGRVDWCYASVDEVGANIEASGNTRERFKLIVGKVEDTIPGTVPAEIALLRLDTDWYESTQHEMEHLFPRLVPGGVFICDDYGFWLGAQKAVDEYLATLDEPFLLTVDSSTGRAIGVRSSPKSRSDL